MPAAARWRDASYMLRAAGAWRGHSWLEALEGGRAARNYTYADFVAAPSGAYLPWKPLPETLRRDLTLPAVFACAPLLNEPGFMSEIHLRMTDGRGDHNGLHFDGGDFFSVQLDGVKRWTMVDPIHSLALYADHTYPPPGPSFGHQVFRERGVNTSRLPRLVEAPALQADVRPSDMVYIPQRWWHEIETLPGRNLGLVVQTHFPAPAAMSRSNAPRRGHEQTFSYDLLEHSIRWRSEPAHSAVPPHLRECLGAAGAADQQQQWARLEEMWAHAVDGTASIV